MMMAVMITMVMMAIVIAMNDDGDDGGGVCDDDDSGGDDKDGDDDDHLPRNNPQDIRVYIILDSADTNSAARAAGEPKFFLFLFLSAIVSLNSLR